MWLKKKKDIVIVAVCDNNRVRFTFSSKKLNQAKFYETIDDMLANENLDMVDICTPPDSHARLCYKTLRAGVNCLVEKPLTTSTSDADEIIRYSKAKKLNVFVAHNNSFFPILRKAKDLVKSGELGDLLQVDVQYSCPLEQVHQNPNHWAHKLPGGLFGEQAPHACYALSEFLDDEILEIKSIILGKSPFSFLPGDELKVIVSTKKTIGAFSVSLIAPQRMTVDLIGSKIWTFVDAESQSLVKYPHIKMNSFSKGKRSLSDITQRANCLTRASFNVITKRWKPLLVGHEYLFNQAIATLRKEGTYPVSLVKARNSVQILESAFMQNGLLREDSLVHVSGST